jgi:RNA polymerase sigma-70 factor (ECF subfamily)
MLRTARRMTGSATTAEELVQEACLKAYRAFTPDAEPTAFRPWLFRILTNLAIDHIRWRRRDVTVPDDGHGVATGDPSPGASPYRVVLAGEIGRSIEVALDELSFDLRAVAVLVLVEEMSYAEAGASLGIGEDLVRSRLSRARAHLKARLGHLVDAPAPSRSPRPMPPPSRDSKRGSP